MRVLVCACLCAAFALWDAKQHNFTVANVPLHDGTTPGPLNYTIGGFRFPPMDYVVAAGEHDSNNISNPMHRFLAR